MTPRLTSAYAALQVTRPEQLPISGSPWLQLRLISGRLRGASTNLRELNERGSWPDLLGSSAKSETLSTTLAASAPE